MRYNCKINDLMETSTGYEDNLQVYTTEMYFMAAPEWRVFIFSLQTIIIIIIIRKLFPMRYSLLGEEEKVCNGTILLMLTIFI